MRWPHESAITRRNDHLARTRRLSLWIAGCATAASLALATAFGYALPGHAVTNSGTQSPAGQGSGQTGQGSGSSHHHGSGQLAPPQQPPAQPAAPPVVSSGGS
jgi:hypothetical protein